MALEKSPLAWRGLTPRLDPARFNLETVPRRRARQKPTLLAELGV
jgi:hypothetical protein